MAANEPGIVKRLLADVTKASEGIAEHMLALQESEQRHKDYLKEIREKSAEVSKKYEQSKKED